MAHSVALNWSAPVVGDAPVSYDIKRAPAPAGVVGTYVSIASVPATSTTYTDTNVTAGQEYSYEVCSVNASGESVPCPNVLATIPLAAPQAPTGLTAVAS